MVNLRTAIISFLVLMGVMLYIYVFFDAMKDTPTLDESSDVLQFAMTIGVSVSAFIGAWLGVDTKRRVENLRRKTLGQPAVPRKMAPWQYKLQFVIIVVYLITLLVGTWCYITNDSESPFIRSLFTNATGLMLGALAVVLSPVEE